jgi:hypothetical protein
LNTPSENPNKLAYGTLSSMNRHEYSIVLAGVIIIIAILSTPYIFANPSEGQEVAKPLAPSNTNKEKPVEGYDSPQGYFTAIKHVYNDPNLRLL